MCDIWDGARTGHAIAHLPCVRHYLVENKRFIPFTLSSNVQTNRTICRPSMRIRFLSIYWSLLSSHLWMRECVCAKLDIVNTYTMTLFLFLYLLLHRNRGYTLRLHGLHGVCFSFGFRQFLSAFISLFFFSLLLLLEDSGSTPNQEEEKKNEIWIICVIWTLFLVRVCVFVLRFIFTLN